MNATKKESDRNQAVLGLVFLKYISDKFESKYHELIKIGEGWEEDRKSYISDNIFWIPKEARWSEIQKSNTHPHIGNMLDKAIELIERENHQLKNLIYKVFSTTDFREGELGRMIDFVNDISLQDPTSHKF